MGVTIRQPGIHSPFLQRRCGVLTIFGLTFLLGLKRVEANICFILYSYADGCEEGSHRQNIKDWIASEAIKDPTITTWVYFNGRSNSPPAPGPKFSFGPPCGIITNPLEDVWTNDGSQLLTDASEMKYEGGMYLMYDHTDNKMKVQKELDDPPGNLDALYDFVSHALQDCMTKGSLDPFLTLNTRGTDGKGDEDERRRLQLKLNNNGRLDFFTRDEEDIVNAPSVIMNQKIVAGLAEVLKNLPEGGPDKFSVMGFDHFFMAGFAVINQFKSITNYFVGSQSIIPAHGWSFKTLSETSSSVALAQEVVKDYVEEPQSTNGEHENSKTMSIVDTGAKFSNFLNALNEYLGVLIELINQGTDYTFFINLHRARSQALTYNEQDQFDDLGSLLQEMNNLCDPKPDSDVHTKIRALLESYGAVFVERMFGPGTVEGTGMYIELPTMEEYRENPDYWDTILFPPSMASVPNYQKFYKLFELTTRGGSDKGNGVNGNTTTSESVCRMGHREENTRLRGDSVFIDPTLSFDDDGSIKILTNLVDSITEVKVRYGINLGTKKLNEIVNARGTLVEGQPLQGRRSLRRSLQQPYEAGENDFLVWYGGQAPGQFKRNDESSYDFEAYWDRKFYVMHEESGQSGFQVIFLEGPLIPTKTHYIDVIYFDKDNKIKDTRNVKRGTTVKEATSEEMGGTRGTLEYHIDSETGEEAFTLFVTYCRGARLNGSGNVDFDPLKKFCSPSEIEPDMQGFIAPILRVRGYVGGYQISELIGAETGNVLEWSPNVKLYVTSYTDLLLQNKTTAESLVLEMEAQNRNKEGDRYTFNLTEKILQQSSFAPQTEASLQQSSLAPQKTSSLSTTKGDVSKCKPAIQSTTIQNAAARHALTGDLSSLAHTDREQNPWWEVDLMEPHAIDSVIVVNRQDCCQERLDGVKVELLDESGQTIAIVQHNIEEGALGNSWTAAFENQSARKVRVSTEWPEGKEDFLNLASVQVISDCTERDSCNHEGPGCDYGDVAICKPAVQSSTFERKDNSAGIGCQAFHAVDGSEFLSHTYCETAPWWEVDLLVDRAISQIVIKNREDCCFDRLDYLKVEVLDQSNQVAGSFQHDPANGGSINPLLIVPFNEARGRKVRVSIDRIEGQCTFLNLQAIEVYSKCLDDDKCKWEDEPQCTRSDPSE